MKKRKRKYLFDRSARLVTAGFSLLLALPAIGVFFTDHAARSRWENRPLADPPWMTAAPKAAAFFPALDRYLNDHFGFSVELNRLYRKLVFYVFRDSPSQDVSIGKDGFVFVTSFRNRPFSVLETLCMGGMDPQQAHAAAEAWEHILDHFAGDRRNVALLIVPSKPTLYPEKLKASVPRRYREACAGYQYRSSVSGTISRVAKDNGHTVIYPFEEFWRRRYEGNFYPRENFHYTGASGHWLARQTLISLGIQPNAAYEQRYSAEIVTHDLMNLLGFTRQLEAVVYPYDAFSIRKDLSKPNYVRDYFANVNQFGTFTSSSPLSRRKALVVGNSFAPFAAEHLAPGYHSLTYIMLNDLQEDEYVRFFTELVPRIDPDDLIFVYNDNVVAFTGPMYWAELRLAAGGPGK